MSIYWLSFCDNDRPVGSKFLGACMVRADSFVEAVREARRLKINPGGECLGREADPLVPIDESYLNRLMSRAECMAYDAHQKELNRRAGVVPRETW